MPLTIIRQDITKMQVDAIVCAANTALQLDGGVSAAILKAAGDELQAACDALAPVCVGQAVITEGYALPANYVIHAVGPDYSPERADECRELLWQTYVSALTLAEEYGCESIAFPLISSGVRGYPKDEALKTAYRAIAKFLDRTEMNIYLLVYDASAFHISRSLIGAVESYIDEHYIDVHAPRRRRYPFAERVPKCPGPNACEAMPRAIYRDEEEKCKDSVSIEDLLDSLDEPFSEMLLQLIDQRHMDDVSVYKRANIDRKLFSKIRSGKGYTPKKPTILALAVALELNLSETEDLLRCAGYALSHASKFDVIVEFFIIRRMYNVFAINEVLFRYDQPLLGSGGN